ncbi:MAG: nitrilase family protein [Muribaculaceae bacterium]|nr:nitrilase family protein [Muribaculaceae bacterium]
MNNNLIIASASLDIKWGNPEANLGRVEKLMTTLPSSVDVVVLPELFSTGFISDIDALNVLAKQGNDTIDRLTQLSRRWQRAIAGSVLLEKGGKYYNRGFFIEPSGECQIYDKAHLFSLSKEAELLEGGTTPPAVVRFRGWNISLIVCYDLRFPVWCRNLGEKYDVMLVPANWPQSRSYAWEHLLIGRAIENQAYYVGTNRSGVDDFGDYDAMNIIVDGLGKPIARSENGIKGEHCIIATLDYTHLVNSRKKLPFQADADEFLLSNQKFH